MTGPPVCGSCGVPLTLVRDVIRSPGTWCAEQFRWDGTRYVHDGLYVPLKPGRDYHHLRCQACKGSPGRSASYWARKAGIR
jgi:hypothetical protein